ncbi:MAG: PQQ-binding-like beta-propeller repeat protein, partial [Candidatus Daviesbacteria bacterium]|nr:PQQ-binding-like beta-propeller repeat protein [Candidatus Daviesbacteria bacterium]
NGNKRWEYSLGGWGGNNIPTGVALSRNKDVLYVGIAYPSKTLLALNIDGSFKWQKSLDYTPVSTPIVALDGTIYVGIGSTGYLYAFTDTGAIKWYRFIGNSDVRSLILDSTSNIYVKSGNGSGGIIVSYNPQGTRRWVYQYSTYSIEGEMALKNSTLYAAIKNNIIAVNTSGNLVWTFTAPLQGTYSLTSPVVDKDGNIYSGMGNKFYVINSDGTLRWEITLTGFLGKPIIADNDLIYIDHRISGTSEGYLHALGKIIPPKTPVIFIPGVGGSELKVKNNVIWSKDDGHGGTYNHGYNAGEKIWVNEGEGASLGDDDYFDILRLKSDGTGSEAELELTGDIYTGAYSNTIKFFTDNGYTLNQDLFVFPYDWRKDIILTAPLLDQKIDAIKTQTGAAKVDLVAHSMGGLVARNYIADANKAGKVRKLINLSTPHLGATYFTKTLLYGDCLTDPRIKDLPICIGVNPSEIKDVIQNMIGAYELAPSQKYYDFYDGSDSNHPLPFVDKRDIDNNDVTGFLNYLQIKTLLSNLGYNTSLFTSSETFHNLDNNLNNLNGVDVSVIAGSGKATTGQIIEDYMINFAGVKIPKTDLRSINGDGTVPLYSSSLVDGTKSLLGSAKVFYTNQKHPDLVASGSAMNLVKNILAGDDNLPTGISATPYRFKGTTLSVHSPVLLNAYDANNNHTGPLANGDYEANIPGSSYEVLGDAKFIWLPDSGIYNLKFAALDQGSFDFKIRTYENNANSKTIVYNNIPLTSQTKATAVFDTSSANPPLLSLDIDGNGVTDTQIGPTGVTTDDGTADSAAPETAIALTGDKNSDESYKTDVKVELSATDNTGGSGIAKIEYSLDNGQTTKTYTDVFTLFDNGTIKIKYRAIDNNGNEENPKTKEIIINKPSSSSDSNSSLSTTISTPTPTLENNNQTTTDGIKKALSNILSFNNKEKSNDQTFESTNSVVLGAKTETGNITAKQNKPISPDTWKLLILPLGIMLTLIIYRIKKNRLSLKKLSH